MNNKKLRSSRWAVLPLLFCSAAVLAANAGGGDGYTDVPAQQETLTLEDDPNAQGQVMPVADVAPDTMNQVQQLGQESDGFVDDSTETSSVNTGYVGGKGRVGVGIDSELKLKAEGRYVIQENENSATIGQGYVGVNPKADSDKNEETVTGAGAKVSHHWTSADENGQVSHVNKVFGAYDQNEQKDKKITAGYGQEKENMFWSGHVSKGLSDARDASDGSGLKEKAYDMGVGGRVGTYLPEQQMRVQGGLDYEWGKDRADGEKKATQTTLSGGVEKFIPGTPHSVGADLEVYKKSGGAETDDQKTETRGGVSYRYDIASEAGVWQADQQYRRVRVEIPGEEIKQQPKMAQKLVKHTMELEADTFFELDKAKLTPEAKERLQAVVGQIRAAGHEGNIRITGNTCDLGSDKHNLDLSQRRANAVRDFMAKNGFSADELIAEGLGESQPKYPNTESERHKNRRVDIEYVNYQNEVKNEVIEEGGTTKTDPKVVWRKELIPSPPLWVRQALHNVADHKETVDTYKTAKGAAGNGAKPNAYDDAATTTASTPVAISVLANDDDPNGDALTIASFTQGGNGKVEVSGNQLVYTPNAGFTGTDTFTYTIQDANGNQDTANVTVTVGANGAPVLKDDAAQTTANTPVTVDVLANDTDPDGGTLSISGFTQPSGGTVTLDGRKLVFTPNKDFTGDTTFTYTVDDGQGNTATASVAIHVVPVAGELDAANDSFPIVQDSKDTVLGVLGNDIYPSEGVTITIVTQPSHGTVTVPGTYLQYTPTAGYTGTDTLTYKITTKDGREDTATVELDVGTCSSCSSLTLTDDYLLVNLNDTVTKTLSVLGNDTGDEMTITSVSTPRYGTAQISSDGKSIKYTLRSGYCADHTFTYTVKDKYGNTKQATVKIDVAPAN